MGKTGYVSTELHRFGTPASASGETPAEKPENGVPTAEILPPELRQALRRRMDDCEHMERDLRQRVEHHLAQLNADIAECSRRAEQSRMAGEQLEKIRQKLEEPCGSGGGSEQADVAKRWRELENLRLDTIRVTAPLEKKKPLEAPQQVRMSAGGMTSPDQIPFWTLMRCGTAFFLPLILAVGFGTILLSAAILAAFNGAIKW